MADLAPWDLQVATDIVVARSYEPGATIEILHELRRRFGYVDRAIVPVLAEALNLSRAEIHGTLTFYHDFRDTPPGCRTIKVCRAEACQSRDGAAMADELRSRLGIGWLETTADRAITIEPVYCLGLCAVAPAVLVDDRPVGRVGVDTLDRVIAEARS